MPVRLDSRRADFDAAFAALVAANRGGEPAVDAAVREIIDDVRASGDRALIRLTERFDGIRLTPRTMRIGDAEISHAVDACTADHVAALREAARRIRAFHDLQRPANLDVTDDDGLRLGYRWTALDAVGLYVPGGQAAYPSSVLMNAIPAVVAGVKRLVMTVPTPNGVIHPLVLAAARIAGVAEIYRIGGAQAVAALAYGTETVRPVDKIVGPGNAYVAAAKRLVFGTVGIDMVAGPSEVLIVADGGNDADWMAVDLLAQAEHDADAQSILITDSAPFADAVAHAVEAHLATLERATIARASWQAHGCIIVVDNLLEQAPAWRTRVIKAIGSSTASCRCSGAIFLGRYVPEALGDYVAGPNHVLPTGRSARFSSGLGVLDFMKRSTFVACDAKGLAAVGPAAVVLAEAEGLSAHARSIALRLNRRRDA